MIDVTKNLIQEEWVNWKNGKTYTVLSFDVINATNNTCGQKMVLYTDDTNTLFVRSLYEFVIKFYKKDI